MSPKSMSAVDVKACVVELKDLIGGRVEKIYHYPPNEIRLKLYAKGRRDLTIEAGKRIHLTVFPKESPRIPSPFAMLLRKHLEKAKIVDIRQHDFDRVVVLEFERFGERRFLIAELFAKGNIVLLDEDFKVVLDLKHVFKSRETYRFPESRITPFDLSLEILKELCRERKEIVKLLAVKCGLGGLFAEEVCLRSGVEKTKIGESLDEDEFERVYTAIRDVFDPVERCEFKPHVVLRENDYIDVLPIELEIYSD